MERLLDARAGGDDGGVGDDVRRERAVGAAFEPLEQEFHVNRDHLADDVKQSLLDLDDETAAGCVQALFDTLQQQALGTSPIDWLREHIAEVNAPQTPAPAPASVPSYCSVA